MKRLLDFKMFVGRDISAAFREAESEHCDGCSRETSTINAIISSLPVLLHRIVSDSKDLVLAGGEKLWNFILPDWDYYASKTSEMPVTATMKQLLQSASATTTIPMTDYMLRHFDANGDGHISGDELWHMAEMWKQHLVNTERGVSWATWFQREWPLMDWKIGIFLWSTFGGILFLLAGFSVIPGRMHGISAKILRWPVLGVVYFLIAVELMCVKFIVRVRILDLGISYQSLKCSPSHRSPFSFGKIGSTR